jgi:hypothetical protein
MIAFCSVRFCTSFRTCMLMRYPLRVFLITCQCAFCRKPNPECVLVISDEAATKNTQSTTCAGMLFSEVYKYQ